jgi:hypothetical protein
MRKVFEGTPAVTLAVALALGLVSARAGAFCGFYVSGADQSLYNNATMVVLMRDGQRTVLSMQNNYQGPPQDFAMVVPVPVVIREENVRTLPREVFERVDRLAAPRLVEYWEQDPCEAIIARRYRFAPRAEGVMAQSPAPSGGSDLGVRIEAQFAVGEYDIVILSARDSAGLETWLHRERYNIPQGASEVLRPYVEAGTKFFVARVDVERVSFVNGRAVLSPLRVHYDTPEFSLPVRLGLLNSSGQQDLIVHILARGRRYEVANYANTMIPTNIRVVDAVRHEFGAFYEYLFRSTVARNPRTVVTEYAWDAGSCDPCPTPPLTPSELATLGGDVIAARNPSSFVLTRLHYRYGRDDLGEDLVFREAPPVVGGTGIPAPDGSMPATQQNAYMNMFQGRYVILHPWEGPIACTNPYRGVWGGPPDGTPPRPQAATHRALTQGIPTALPDGARFLAEDVPAIGAVAGGAGLAPGTTPASASAGSTPVSGTGATTGSLKNQTGSGAGATGVPAASPPPSAGGCAGCAVTDVRGSGPAVACAGAALIALGWQRRRRARGGRRG